MAAVVFVVCEESVKRQPQHAAINQAQLKEIVARNGNTRVFVVKVRRFVFDAFVCGLLCGNGN